MDAYTYIYTFFRVCQLGTAGGALGFSVKYIKDQGSTSVAIYYIFAAASLVLCLIACGAYSVARRTPVISRIELFPFAFATAAGVVSLTKSCDSGTCDATPRGALFLALAGLLLFLIVLTMFSARYKSDADFDAYRNRQDSKMSLTHAYLGMSYYSRGVIGFSDNWFKDRGRSWGSWGGGGKNDWGNLGTSGMAGAAVGVSGW